jgi:hypothetical protein
MNKRQELANFAWRVMNLIVNNNTKTRTLSHGAVGYGSTSIGSPSGSYETCEVELSARAANVVEIGDTISFYECGQSKGCYREMKGEILKADGTIFHLTGGRDNGMYTGHSPSMNLEMVKAMKLVMSPVRDSIKLFKENEIVYVADLTRERMMFSYDGDIFNPEVQLEKGQVASIVWGEQKLNGWTEGLYTVSAPAMKEVDTNKPRISHA